MQSDDKSIIITGKRFGRVYNSIFFSQENDVRRTVMLTEKQCLDLVELQDKMNSKVNLNWRLAKYPFLRAAMMEGAEAIEHTGQWKWWKGPSEIDLPQLQMELVDIFHFFISDIIVSRDGNIPEAAKVLKVLSESRNVSAKFDDKIYIFDEMDLVERLELMIGLSAARRVDIPLFSTILKDCLMTWDNLYRHYIGKNVLNIFRQDNGYKEGSYKKIWLGREDNVHLSEIILDLNSSDEDFPEMIYHNLSKRYRAINSL